MRIAKCLHRLVSAMPRFARDARAIAAVEFALLLPVMIMLLLGAAEMTRLLNTQRAVNATSAQMAQMLSASPSSPFTDLNFINTTFMGGLNFPQLQMAANASSSFTNISIRLASIAFTPAVAGCTSSCTYKGQVLWSNGWSCGAVTSVADGTANAANTVPASLFGPNPLVAVQVSYTYTPIFGSALTGITGPIKLSSISYAVPRYVTTLNYSGSDVTTCAGNNPMRCLM